MAESALTVPLTIDSSCGANMPGEGTLTLGG